jgi:putative oxidoreductase
MKIDFRWVDLGARVLMCVLFLMSGFGKLASVAGTEQFMEQFGVPGILLWPAAALELAGGLMLLAGFQVRPLSVVLAGWCLLTAAIFHTAFSDPVQMIMFLKNLTMAGGFLILAKNGAPGFGLDGTRHGAIG